MFRPIRGILPVNITAYLRAKESGICDDRDRWIYRPVPVIIKNCRYMKATVLFVFAIFLCSVLSWGQPVQNIQIIPQPVNISLKPGRFLIDRHTQLVVTAEDSKQLAGIAFSLSRFSQSVGIHLSQKSDASFPRQIRIQVVTDDPLHTGEEGYTLHISPSLVLLKARRAAGIFHGLQSLLQLLPPGHTGESMSFPCAEIIDYPRFAWRGLMLDVSRHFFTKNEVKKFIDEMARYKFNVFHWHLSDDNGWRVEIRSLPQLTKTGAWRVSRTGTWGNFQPGQPGEPADYGGYYTQDDVREILQYAQQRCITVVPEIDVPAHSLSLIASFPNLSCTQLKYQVNPGTAFYTKEDNALCIGNDSVFLVLDKVFTEIAALFPGTYVHIGCDEPYKEFWKRCPKCQKRMLTEHLKNVDELQNYFVKRIESTLRAHGKKIIGWDEILEGGLTPDATVMSWRGMNGGQEAARQKHQVIMTPSAFTYLDLYQGDPNVEPNTYGLCTLGNAYHFDPVPEGTNPSYILGGEGALWSESIPNFRHAEYMMWPRALALSEVFWSPKNAHNWNGFIGRVETEFKYLDAEKINYAKSMYNTLVKTSLDKNANLLVRLGCDVPGVDIFYTFDDTNPDTFSPQYNGKDLSFPKGATQLKVMTYRKGIPVGRQFRVLLDELRMRAKSKPDF